MVLWDGGNNDFPFYVPDLMVTVVDPLRAGPRDDVLAGRGHASARRRRRDQQDRQRDAGRDRNRAQEHRGGAPNATVIDAASPLTVDDPSLIKGKRVLVIEDGPTVTHGDMTTGAAKVAAAKFGAAELVDPRPFLKGSLVDMFELYPHVTDMLPAEGYGGQMLKDMEDTVNAVDCDAVIVGTPIDLARIINIKKPNDARVLRPAGDRQARISETSSTTS